MSTIKERVLQIADYKKISKENFFKKIGMSYGNFKGSAKKTPLNSDAVAKILTYFPEINPIWLLTGEGSMLRGPSENDIQELATLRHQAEILAQQVEMLTQKIEAQNEALEANKKLVKAHETILQARDRELQAMQAQISAMKKQLHECQKRKKPVQ